MQDSPAINPKALSLRNPIIELKHVGVCYEPSRPVLRDINLTVDRGSFIAITGPNGGGKTTLLRVILKLLRPTSGKVEYLHNGKPVKTCP